MKRCLFLLPALLAALGSDLIANEEVDSFARAARGVLRRHCLRCHSGEGSEGGYARNDKRPAGRGSITTRETGTTTWAFAWPSSAEEVGASTDGTDRPPARSDLS